MSEELEALAKAIEALAQSRRALIIRLSKQTVEVAITFTKEINRISEEIDKLS